MAGRTIRRALLAAALLGVAALILPPFVNVGRYKIRIVDSMSRALGRPVSCDSIGLRLLPRPGFTLSNVTIGDDPAYSAEPILYADDVTAYLSIRSLWRGHMEFSRLALDYPSLNVVEGVHGGWNLESLLWKASQTRTSPTAAGQSAARPRFPYIEASNGRINFKYGIDKSVFSFVDADFSLWSPAVDQWRMRLKARPVRTDMPVSDTGVVKAEVAVQRAPRLRDAPIQATLSWENVQIGNLTRLVSGRDRGWRGAVEAQARLTGTAQQLRVSGKATFSGLRRYDIIGGEPSTLRTSCDAVLSLTARSVEQGECRLPLDGGTLALQGSIGGLRPPHYDFTLTAEDLGANTLLNLARRARRNLPEDLTAGGTISASFHVSRLSDESSTWIGNLEMNSLKLHSAELGKDLRMPRIAAEINTAAPPLRRRRAVLPPQRALQIERFRLPLGGTAPAMVDGSLDARHFALHVKGDASLQRLQEVARTLGIGAPKLSLTGAASLQVTLSGAWSTPETAQLAGSATVQHVRAKVPGIADPVEIPSAKIAFAGDRFTISKGSASVGRITLAGSASFPRSCQSGGPCWSNFHLTTGELNLALWNRELNPHLKKRHWYDFGRGSSSGSAMASLKAAGTLRARRLTLKTARGTITRGSGFATSFTVANGVLACRDARVNLFGGRVSGDWSLDWTSGEAQYTGSGAAVHVEAEKLAALLGASPGSGRVSFRYKVRMSGDDQASLVQSARAAAQFQWSGGWLRLSPEGRPPLRVRSGKGSATFGENGWTISDSQWRTDHRSYRLRGTIARSSALDLEFTRKDGSAVRLRGSLNKPRLAAPAAPVAAPRRRLR